MSTELRRLTRGLVLMLACLLAAPAWAGGTWAHERGTLELDATPTRVVALNWAATEALLLLGIVPVGVADLAGYPVWVQEPPLPEGPQNVGSRSSPSLEAIAELRPDLIVTSGQLAPAWEQLRDIAPTYVISVYDKDARPYERARAMLLTLGQIFGREERARAVLAEQDRVLAEHRRRLERAGLTERPVALVNFMDDRHVRINTPRGILQAGLEGLGLENAWHKPGNFWGFSLVGLEALADMEQARLVAIRPIAPNLPEQLAQSPFWQYLPMVQQDRVYQIDPVWAYGGVHSVTRLARLLTEALLAGGDDNVDG